MAGGLYKIHEILKANGVPFLIIGGFAVNFHGYIRATEDVDIIFRRSARSEKALFRALKSLNAYWISDEKDSLTGLEKTFPVSLPFIRAANLMMLGTDLGFLDIYDYVPGFPQADLREIFSSSLESGGFKYVSRDWLLKMKKAAGRAKDLLDIENLS